MPHLALALTLIGYVLLMLTNPVRASLRDGWRCVRRYPVLWWALAGLAFANAAFLCGVRLFAHWRGETRLLWMRPGWNDPSAWLAGTPDSLWWLPAADLQASLEESILPGLETLAGLFNSVVTTFPIAALAALGLLLNRRRGLSLLRAALRRRFGLWSWPLLLATMAGACATLAKAVLYFRPAWVPSEIFAVWSPGIAAVAALFEYGFGVAVQAYLLLHAYAWVRGLSFQTEAIRAVAIRRVGAAAKWIGLVLLIQALCIELPLVTAVLYAWPASPAVIVDQLPVVRLVFAAVLLCFASMQAWLTLHGETVGRAWRAHWSLMWRQGWPISWFLVVAGIHCYGAQVLRVVVLRALGEDTAPGLLWTLLWPICFGLIAGWLLASWVCLFKRAE